jgi:hypothetical protein
MNLYTVQEELGRFNVVVTFLQRDHPALPATVIPIVVLTTDFREEAFVVAKMMGEDEVKSLRSRAKATGKKYFKMDIADRNSAIARRHRFEGESIKSLADRFKLSTSTIAKIIADFERPRPIYLPLGGL